MKHFIYFVLVFLFSQPITNAQQTITGSFEFDGLNRTYRLYVPDAYNGVEPVPLILNLHGYGSNNIEQEVYGDFRPIADTAGFLVVHPNGTPDNFNIMHWNTFGTSNVDDIGFLSALIDTLLVHYNIDAKRVYSTGMSNGGFMSFSLACSLSNRIAAIASVTGSNTSVQLNTCSPERPVPIMQIHGTADATVPYEGNALFVPVQAVLDFWVGHNNCSATPIITEVPDIDPNDGCTAEHYLYPYGDNGSVVEHYKILGGGHSWPGAPININVTNMDFSASEEIWRFFSQYDLDGLVTGASDLAFAETNVRIGPNPATGQVWIEIAGKSESTISIMNGQGIQLNAYTTDKKNLMLNLPSQGLFLITILQEGRRETFKVINQ
jgi:polyhydroxybutyrate depolymerase